MTRAEAKAYLKSKLPEYLERVHDIKLEWLDAGHVKNFRCPFGSGAHVRGDRRPSAGIYNGGQQVHCFTCDISMDIFDMIGNDFDLDGYGQQFAKACELFELDVPDMPRAWKQGSGMASPKQAVPARQAMRPPTAAPAAVEIDVTERARAAHEACLTNPAALNHYHARGLSDDIIKKYWLGFMPFADMMKGSPVRVQPVAPAYSYILPFPPDGGRRVSYFVAEITDRARMAAGLGKYLKPAGVRQQIYNARRLKQPGPCWIVEGIFDALAIEQAGGHAIATCGTGVRMLMGMLDKGGAYIVGFDNDEPGREAGRDLVAFMDANGMQHACCEWPDGVKDANEFLMNDSNGFSNFIKANFIKARGLK